MHDVEVIDARDVDVVDRVRFGRLVIDVTYERRPNGVWLATATLDLPSGRALRARDCASEREAHALIAKYGRELAQVCGDSPDVAVGARRIARRRALSRFERDARKALRDVRTTLDRPELQPVLSVAQQIPYVGPALTALRAATTVADDLVRQNPRTTRDYQRVRQAARAGHPAARKTVRLVDGVLAAQRHGVARRARDELNSEPLDSGLHDSASDERRRVSSEEEHAWQRAREAASAERSVLITPAPAR